MGAREARWGVWLGLLATACDSRAPSAPPGEAASAGPAAASAPTDAARPAIRRGTVRIDPPDPGPGKPFSGIWLDTAEGRLLVSYRRDDVFSLFADRQVTFDGEPYQPEGQSIAATHFRPGRVELADATREDLYRAIGPGVRTCGVLRTSQHPPGTKLAGESIREFVEHGRVHWYRAVEQPADGSYVLTMRALVHNDGYAPELPVAMAMPADPVWLSDFVPVAACPE